MYPVITISRQFGSGGRSIGRAVAEELEIPFFDGEIINKIAESSGYAKETVENSVENLSSINKWFDVSAASAMYYQSPQDEIFLATRKFILEQAEAGPCVIVGRCADYILRDAGVDCLNVLIHADMEHRINRVTMKYGEIKDADVAKRIKKKDKQRKSYYRYYTDEIWGDYHNYDLCLDSGKIGEDMCIRTICDIAKSME